MQHRKSANQANNDAAARKTRNLAEMTPNERVSQPPKQLPNYHSVNALVDNLFSNRTFSTPRKNHSFGVISARFRVLPAARPAFQALFEKVSRLDMASKKVLQKNEKYYVADHGLREAVYGGKEQAVELIFENIVCLELLRRGYTLTIGRTGENEIDFVGRRNGEYLYVQVCYLLASPETVEREFGPLANIADNYPKYVVSDDDWDMSRDGIRHRNIRDFLLQDEY